MFKTNQVFSFRRRSSRPGSRTGMAWVLLCCFLVRGVTPMGFMPTSLAQGAPYGLCHGDIHSAQLLQLLTRVVHHDSSGHDQGQQNVTHQATHHGSHQDTHHGPHSTSLPQEAPQDSGNLVHDHDEATARAFADNHCSFSVGAGMLLESTPDLAAAVPDSLPLPFTPVPAVAWQITYLQPPTRAPPTRLA